MKLMMKNFVKRLIAGFLAWLPSTLLGRYIYRQIINAAMNQKKVASYCSNQMAFTVPNGLNQYRISTFSTLDRN
tara:strand:+ start:333 stop:554 length:222 start_codon:yes stop_codon:yes gene_type:complete